MKFSYPTVLAIEPGMHGLFNIENDAYHSGQGVSSTRLKKALGSYLSYTTPTKDTKEMRFGRAFHTLMCEPWKFPRDYAIEPEISGHKNSNAYKAGYAAWEATLNGREPIDREDHETLQRMCYAVRNYLTVPDFAGYVPEVMGITTCKETDLLIKCKADMLGEYIIDFKSTSSGVGDDDIEREVIKRLYHLSAAFYQDIIASVTGEYRQFHLIAVTKTVPIEVGHYLIPEDVIMEGRRLYKAALRRVARWMKMPLASRVRSDQRIRVLQASQRMKYSTDAILNSLESA